MSENGICVNGFNRMPVTELLVMIYAAAAIQRSAKALPVSGRCG